VLSLQKILLTAAIVAAVWLVGRMLTRRAGPLTRKPSPEPPKSGPVDLAKCAVCDTYVGRNSSPCERPDCPQRT
jgi:hypothetical protein